MTAEERNQKVLELLAVVNYLDAKHQKEIKPLMDKINQLGKLDLKKSKQ